MNFFWLKSCLSDESDLSRYGENVIAFDSRPGAVPNCGTIIAEVKTSDDARRAFRFLDEAQAGNPVWIYQPAATVESTEAFIKAGAARMLTTSEDVGRAMNSARPAGFSPHNAQRNPDSHRTLIGASSSMQSVSSRVGLIANRRCNVLIEGETGTGKEVVAREIHRSGGRSRGPWVPVNCGALPEPLLEAELFGHVKGAFTGAVQGRIGKFEAANHGTIFLDEIADMPFALQARLLRVLQEKEVERLGANERIRLDVRVIAATNANLLNRVREGLFRQDLYYRLNVFQIVLPPLRDRLDDVSELARHFIARMCADENIRPKNLDVSAMDQLLEHTWPGNVRELENVLEMAVILSGSRTSIFASDIRITPEISRRSRPEHETKLAIPPGGLDYQQALEAFEHDLLTQALTRTRGNKTAAAELLRLKRTTLSARMRVLESRLPRLVA